MEVERLGRTPAVVACPSCGQVIMTETCRKVGAAMWMTCVTSAMLGYVTWLTLSLG